MRLSKISSYCIFILLLTISLYSIENDTTGITVKIELANPKIYYQNDEIYINVKIFNNSSKEKSLLIADDKRYSFDFEMVTLQNKEIEHSNDYSISFHRVQPVFNTLARINPNEGYVYKARLNDYHNIDKVGQYYVKCLYYPDLKLNYENNNTILSNQISINIRPQGIQEKTIIEKKAVEKEKMMFATKRPPDDVVRFTLDARMNKEWEKYFLYLDLEKLILTNNRFRERYIKADAEKQREIIEQYKIYLKQNYINEISFLPHKYEIIKTEYTKGRGKVDVIIYFKDPKLDYIEQKYYTYFLNMKGNIWYIYSYEVLNLGDK